MPGKILFFILFTTSLFAQTPIKIMTYNLQGMKPGTAPEIRIIHIIDKLIEINPDIIGLQEINESLNGDGLDNQAKFIADSLSAYFGTQYNYFISYTHLSWDNQFREFIGIITKYAVEDEGYFSLVPGVFPRKVVWNSIITPLGKINFFNTHLSFNSASVRLQQAQQIASYIQSKESNYPAIASVLTGDFNDSPGAASIQFLTNTSTDTFFVSTFADANPGLPGYTYPSNNPISKIDYIFYKNTGHLSIDTSFIVMNQPYSGSSFCSDHLSAVTLINEGVSDAGESIIHYPEDFKLFQNYPNPFNPNTKIKFYIPDLNFVSLKIYDVLGNEILTLVNEEKPEGNYEVDFSLNEKLIMNKSVSSFSNGNSTTYGYPSGVYFYRLAYSTFSETKK